MVVATLLEHFLCNVVESIGFGTVVVCKTHTSLKPTEKLDFIGIL